MLPVLYLYSRAVSPYVIINNDACTVYLVYAFQLPSPAACDQKSAQWNCSSCSMVMAYDRHESCHSVRGFISLLYWHSQESSPTTSGLHQEHGLHALSVYMCILPSMCPVCPVIHCCFLHALWVSQIIPLTFDL